MANYNQRYFSLFFVLISCLACSCHAYNFVVGGRDGWVLNPSENYNHWAERMRFQVNDTLLFKYNSTSDSVLVVNKSDYDSCNTGSPIQRLTGGNSVFKFERSGPFYFISGNQTSCNGGQKLIVVVMAVRNRNSPPSPIASSPSPAGGAPSPTGGAPTPAGGAPSPSGGAPSPSGGAPSPTDGAPSPTGGAPTPSGEAPGTGGAPTPSGGAPGTGEAPGASGPSTGSSTSPGSPNSSPSDGGSPPPPRSFAAAQSGPSVVLMLGVSFVLSVGLGGFVSCA